METGTILMILLLTFILNVIGFYLFARLAMRHEIQRYHDKNDLYTAKPTEEEI